LPKPPAPFEEIEAVQLVRAALDRQVKKKEAQARDYIQTRKNEIMSEALAKTKAATKGHSKASREHGSKTALAMEKAILSAGEGEPLTDDCAFR
jgi:hypothetical protein